MKRPVQRLSNYFTISEKEANGFIILSGIMLFLLVCPYWYRIIHQQYGAGESQLIIASTITASADYSDESFSLFPFDPNNVSAEDLHTLGLSASLVQRIEKYRNAGGKFKIRSDLKKIYGFPDEIYARLYDFIQLPDSVIIKRKAPLKETPHISKININRATEQELQSLKGIGPVLSGRIIKYRELLGGYISIDQLKEVYGMDTALVDRIKADLFVSPDFSPRQILLQDNPYHPYLNKQQRKCLLAVRKKYPDTAGETLIDSCGFSPEDIIKLRPYLK